MEGKEGGIHNLIACSKPQFISEGNHPGFGEGSKVLAIFNYDYFFAKNQAASTFNCATVFLYFPHIRLKSVGINPLLH